MDGAKRTAGISERTTSQFNDNNNNSQNDSEIPAGVSTRSLGLTDHSFMSMLVPPSPLHFTPFSYMPFSYSNESSDSLSPAIGSSVNQQPVTQGSSTTLSSFENNALSGTEGSHSETIGLKNCDGEEFPSSDGCAYYKDDIWNAEYSYSYSSMSHSPHQHHATMTVGSSSSAGNVPSEVEDIEFGGKIIPATPVELTPTINSTHTGESETALSVPPPQDSDVPQVDRPAYVCYELTPTDYLAQQRAHISSIANPSLRAFMEAQMLTQSFYLNMLNNNPAAIQNYNHLPLEDEDSADDADEAEDDVEEETDDRTNEEPILEGEQEAIVDDGLDEEAIVEALRTEKYKSTSTMACGCTVCWEQYKDGENLGILDCDSKHKFHYKCIKRWLMRQNSCPLCRMNGLIL